MSAAGEGASAVAIDLAARARPSTADLATQAVSPASQGASGPGATLARRSSSTEPAPAPVASTSRTTASPPSSSTTASAPPSSAFAPPAQHAAPPKVITLLRRPSSGPGQTRSRPALDAPLASPSASATAVGKKAASEGTGGGARSPSPGSSSYRRTGSEPFSEPPSASTSALSDGTDRSTSSSPAPPASSVATLNHPRATDSTRDNGSEGAPPLDEAILLALGTPKDRLLLLRAELEMERFVADPARTRLPLAPPHFSPGLNSYQRLLIHRLADTFGISREVEPSPRGPPGASVPTVAVVVLVKGAETRSPPLKLTTYLESLPSSIATSTSSDPSSPSPSLLPSPSSSTTNLSLPPPQQKYKILPRHTATSSASSSTGPDDGSEGGRGGRGRKDKSLEERELAYKEARERIFKEKEDAEAGLGSAGRSQGIIRPSSAGSTYSRTSNAVEPPDVMGQPPLQGYYLQQPQLRPSAPSFDPHGGGWTPYTYAPEYPQVAHGTDPYGYPAPWPPSDPAAYHVSQEVDWSRQQPPRRVGYDQARLGVGSGSGSGAQSPAYGYQPPIQVTAPSPHPPHTYTYPAPPPPPQQLQQQQPYPPNSAWVQRPAIPSPALSTSSSAGSGYLMRFADQTSAYPSHPPLTRSTSSASSTSTSRNHASRANSQSSQAGGPTSHSASHSLSSIASGGGSSSSPRSSVHRSASSTSSSGGGSSDRDRAREGREREATATTAGSGSEVSKKQLPPLHPSLPQKPEWLTALPPPVERSAHGRKSSFGSERSSAPHTPPTYAPHPLLPQVQQQHHHQPPQHSHAPYYDPNAAYYAAPPPPMPLQAWPQEAYQQQQMFYAQQQQHHAPPPDFYQPQHQDGDLLAHEMRRPPPRSTQLFNPNDPPPPTTMKRTGSGSARMPQRGGGGGGRETDAIERGVEQIGLGG